MNNNFNTIDPSQSNLSDLAVIEKVISEEDRLPDLEHEKAAKAFLLSDSIASGIGRDFAFVQKIPEYIKKIIDNKSWECLYVAKGVVTPYYCRYTKGTDSENFRAFITAKRPNGLETNIEIVENILNSNREIKRQFQDLIYESRQGKRTDLIDEHSTSYGHRKKSEGELSSTQKSVIRAANRAAEAIPIISELLDRGLIAIDLAAKLGRDIKDPNNLTADEREYVENRDLIGLRINQHINYNPIPEDEYKEPAYSREFNRFVKDLLGIKNRSKQVRMDSPQKAADKLLQFYKGDKLKALIDYLQQGGKNLSDSTIAEKTPETPKESTAINPNQNCNVPKSDKTNELDLKQETEVQSIPSDEDNPNNFEVNEPKSDKTNELDLNQEIEVDSTPSDEDNQNNFEVTEPTNPTANLPILEEAKQSEERDLNQETEVQSTSIYENSQSLPEVTNSQILEETPQTKDLSNIAEIPLTIPELAQRLGLKPESVKTAVSKYKEGFPEWSKKRDPQGISWQKSQEKRGRIPLFIPVSPVEELPNQSRKSPN